VYDGGSNCVLVGVNDVCVFSCTETCMEMPTFGYTIVFIATLIFFSTWVTSAFLTLHFNLPFSFYGTDGRTGFGVFFFPGIGKDGWVWSVWAVDGDVK